MNVVVTIRYTTDEWDDSGFHTVNDSIGLLLQNTLPYMVDNVEITFDAEEEEN